MIAAAPDVCALTPQPSYGGSGGYGGSSYGGGGGGYDQARPRGHLEIRGFPRGGPGNLKCVAIACSCRDTPAAATAAVAATAVAAALRRGLRM